MISKNQKEQIVRTGSSGGVDVSQTKKAPAVTTMHSNTRTHAVMWTGFGEKMKNACGQAVSGIRKSKAPAANMPFLLQQQNERVCI
jgi:chloramphenicol O-acetyltransferase